jgi:hypothetical protein
VFIHLPEQHVIGGLRLFPSNMQPLPFSKSQLTAIALMLDKEEKNAALSDKKNAYVGSKVFQKQKIIRRIPDFTH